MANEEIRIPTEVNIPKSHILFGDIVHWVTILSCVIALVGPIFAIMNPMNNVISPSGTFDAIFAGEKPAVIWALKPEIDSDMVRSIPDENGKLQPNPDLPSIAKHQDGTPLEEGKALNINDTLTINGQDVPVFPGTHFYLKYFTTGDGFTQFGIALGCMVGLIALVPSMVLQAKEKDYIYVFISGAVALLILLAMLGVLNVQTG